MSKEHHSIIILVIALLAIFVGGMFYTASDELTSEDKIDTTLLPLTIPTSQNAITVTPGIERWYTNPKRVFSFRLPDGFYAPDIETGQPGVYGVRVYNDAGALLTVYAYPIGKGTVLNAETIQANLPDVVVTDIKERVVSSFIPGFEFKTDDAELGGNGLVLWAMYDGYLHEISSSSNNQELFEFVVDNWYFAPPSPSAP